MTDMKLIREEDIEELLDATQADNHIAIAPTHVVRKDGEMIGYASIAGIPLVHWWLDSEKGTAMDTIRVQRACEARALDSGITHYQILCSDDSPYLPKMQKLGYKFVGKTNLFVKEIV